MRVGSSCFWGKPPLWGRSKYDFDAYSLQPLICLQPNTDSRSWQGIQQCFFLRQEVALLATVKRWSSTFSEVWTRVLWILRVPPDKRAFSRAGMLVCQPWLWPDTFRHYQFRGITSIKGITSISSSTGITSSHGCGFARHTSPNKTDSYFFRAFSGFCGPSPVLRAFSGFAGLLRVCVLPQPLRARSFLFLFFKKIQS